MGDEIQKIIDALQPIGEKIGEGATHLYEVAVRESFIHGFSNLFWMGISLIFIVVGLWKVPKFYRKGAEAPRGSDEEDVNFILALVLGALAIIAVPVFVMNGMYAIHNLGNPEFQALKYILEAVTGGGDG